MRVNWPGGDTACQVKVFGSPSLLFPSPLLSSRSKHPQRSQNNEPKLDYSGTVTIMVKISVSRQRCGVGRGRDKDRLALLS